MSNNNQIFRKVSLERLSSPEQLDLLMRVTSSKGWVALIALCGLVMMAIYWGFFGSIPTKVRGSCILMSTNGASEIVSPGVGRVTDISVNVGDSVHQGQIVARIDRFDALDQIRIVEAKLHELKEQEIKLKDMSTKSEQQQMAYLLASEKNLNNRVRSQEDHLSALETKIQAQAELLEQGLITKQAWLGTKLEYANTQQEIAHAHNETLKIGVNRTDMYKQIQNELTSISIHINETSRNLANQLRSYNESTLVYSPYDGRVLEIRLSENTLINAGVALLTIEQTGVSNELEARIYVSPQDGKNIKINMDVHISPSTVKPEKFGFMLGNVRSVSLFPSSADSAMNELKNDVLVKTLFQNSSPITLRADLIPSITTTSGYKWSSPKGPEVKIESGTLCSATITVRKDRPIGLVIPVLRNVMGIM
jgi:HlyD family secretion protein